MTQKVTYGSPGRDWMRRAAEMEDRHESVTVGGLASELGMLRSDDDERPKVLGRLVEWRRLELGMTEQQLADRTGLNVAEVRAIEQDDEAVVSRVMVIFKIAEALQLPSDKLAVLAGIAEFRDGDEIEEATMRFAAKSSTAKLSKEQRRVLDEYVKVLSKSSEGA
mgnify:CR=1 FL=1